MPSTLSYFPHFLNLDMDSIIRYHWCFPCQNLTCFEHPFSLVGHRSIWHNNLACIFALPFLGFVFFGTRWWERPLRNSFMFALIHGIGLGDITKETYKYNTCIDFSKIFRDGTGSYSTYINTIASHTSTCSCRGICLSSACIRPQFFCGPIS
jgi:hypothetical protein